MEMRPVTVALNRVRLSDAEFLEIHSAHFSLRVAIIFLIVAIIIFAMMELVKLICQIMKIHTESDKQIGSEIPEIIVHKKKAKRRPKHSLPSKDMSIRLSLSNEGERDTAAPDDHKMSAETTATITTTTTTITDKEKRKDQKKELQKEVGNVAKTNVAPQDDVEYLSDELTPPKIKDSLAIFDSPNASSSLTSTTIKPTSPPSTLKARDSLMIVNDETSLKRSDSAEEVNRNAVAMDDTKNTLLSAKPQDSLMVVNDQKPLQSVKDVKPVEKTSKSEPKPAESKSEPKPAESKSESKPAEQNEIAL